MPADRSDDDAVERSRASAVVAAVERRPLLTVAVAGVVVGLHHLWVIHRLRYLGAFPLDDAGYLATAFRLQRELASGGPSGVLGSLPTETGPLVPVASIPLLVLRPRSLLAAMAIQPLFHVVAAIGVAGIVRRTAGARPALVGGLVALALPAATVVARSYQYAGAASCFLVLALWGLIASDRGRRTWPLVGAGAALGAMTLARTMTVAFLPGVLVAFLLLVPLRRDRARAIGLAAAAAAVVALPWWAANLSSAWGYLTASGYSAVAERFGPAGVGARIVYRVEGLWSTVRAPLLLPAAVLTFAAAVSAVVELRDRRARGVEVLADRARGLLALWVVVGAGFLALLTSANRVVTSSELPLLMVGVAAVASAAPLAAPTVRRLAGGFAVVAAVLNLVLVGHVAHGWFAGHEVTLVDLAAIEPAYEEHPSSTAPRDAAAAWWNAHLDLVFALDQVEEQSPAGTSRIVSGSSVIAGGNTLLLAEEAMRRPRPQLEVDPRGSPAPITPYLTPRRGEARTVIVLFEPAGVPAAEIDAQRAKATEVEAAGFEVAWSVPLPDGGRVRVFLHPDGASG